MLVDRFELALDRSPEFAVRDLAREESQRARDLLLSHGASSDEAVHDFRKSMKGLRALARLVRRGLGHRFRRCNRALRDAGRLLSDLRDEEALLEALAALRQDFQDGAERRVVDLAERRLTMHQAGLNLREHLADRFPLAVEALTHGATLLETVKLGSYEDLADGLRLSYRAARKRYRQISKGARDDSTLHELRKRIKDHRFHLELLGPSAPSELRADQETADQMSDLLGLDHDLVLLGARLPTLALDPEIALELEHLIESRRAEHQGQALELGGRLLNEPPKKRAARILAHVRHNART